MEKTNERTIKARKSSAYELRPANFLKLIDRNSVDNNKYYNIIVNSKIDNATKIAARDMTLELSVVAALDAFCDTYKTVLEDEFDNFWNSATVINKVRNPSAWMIDNDLRLNRITPKEIETLLYVKLEALRDVAKRAAALS